MMSAREILEEQAKVELNFHAGRLTVFIDAFDDMVEQRMPVGVTATLGFIERECDLILKALEDVGGR